MGECEHGVEGACGRCFDATMGSMMKTHDDQLAKLHEVLRKVANSEHQAFATLKKVERVLAGDPDASSAREGLELIRGFLGPPADETPCAGCGTMLKPWPNWLASQMSSTAGMCPECGHPCDAAPRSRT